MMYLYVFIDKGAKVYFMTFHNGNCLSKTWFTAVCSIAKVKHKMSHKQD